MMASAAAFWVRAAGLAVCCLLTAACQTNVADGNQYYYDGLRLGPNGPLDTKYYPSDEPLREGRRQFEAGSYGLAQRHFQAAVEQTPRDATAWVGLAASYDRLGRFDLADMAYEKATLLTGPTLQILNNRGYSQLLRGDLRGARRYFLQAYEMAPGNPTVANNLELLSNSAKFVERDPAAY